MENTGITYTSLKQCLYELANFVRESLVPDRMHGFDLQTILEEDDHLNKADFDNSYMDHNFA